MHLTFDISLLFIAQVVSVPSIERALAPGVLQKLEALLLLRHVFKGIHRMPHHQVPPYSLVLALRSLSDLVATPYKLLPAVCLPRC